MFPFPFRLLLAVFLVGSFFNSMGVVKEEELLARWTFDEGNGSVAADATGGGLDLLLEDNARWGLEENNTAISKHSLDIRNGDAHALALANDKLKATGEFTYLFWFKTNSQPDAYTQLLSKRKDGYASYFVQVEPDGKHLKTIVRSFGTYYDNGAIGFSFDQWHQLAFSFDGSIFNTFLDGDWVGSSKLDWPIDANDGDLGVGASPEGSSAFAGWIDDLRFYRIALHPRDILESYGRGAGDFGVTPTFLVNRATSEMPLSVTLGFWDKNQNPVQINGFELDDISVAGATLSNLQPSGLNYTFDLNATVKPQRIVMEIPAGRCHDDQNVSNSYGSVVIVYSDLVTKSEDLVGWWPLMILMVAGLKIRLEQVQPLFSREMERSILTPPSSAAILCFWMVMVMALKFTA